MPDRNSLIRLKTANEIEMMAEAGRIVALAFKEVEPLLAPGVTTWEIDRLINSVIVKQGAVPSFLGYGGFPASACVSLNDEVIHGIPSKKRSLKEGDVVSIDVGAFYKGFHGDSARSFIVGNDIHGVKHLLDITRECLDRAIAVAIPGARIGDISFAVQSCAESAGYTVVREFVGHGVGRKLHEAPEVPNFGAQGRGVRLQPGMTIAIEPMINKGAKDIYIADDEWTVATTDGMPSAHFEHTIAITEGGARILTTLGEGEL